MRQYHEQTGMHYEKYRNHVYRVYFNCLLLDNRKEHEEKYAVAAVLHDIGIWTHHTIDYLQPSIHEARKYLEQAGKKEWAEEITMMILWHHKTTRYKGSFESTVETFRKADWIDVSLGLLSFGLKRQAIKENKKRFPNMGFHAFLAMQVIKNFFRHPFNPLPMFKK